jgi:hypothetical protein
VRRILTFIGLKTAEISAIVFIPWGVGLYIHNVAYWNRGWLAKWVAHLKLHTGPVWIDGLGFLFIHSLMLAILIFAVYLNWLWAKQLTAKED